MGEKLYAIAIIKALNNNNWEKNIFHKQWELTFFVPFIHARYTLKNNSRDLLPLHNLIHCYKLKILSC